MVAKNPRELQEILERELNKVMTNASDIMLKDMQIETNKFYTGKKPKKYKRTKALGKTPRVTKPKTTTQNKYNTTISFEAYLNQEHKYNTGDNPTMDKVLELANYGKSWAEYVKPTVGKKGFWERAEKRMEKSFEKVMKQNFK